VHLSALERTPDFHVSASGQVYRGFHPYKMDPKFRTSIPTDWRPAAGEKLFLLFAETHDMPVVRVITQADYDRRVRIVEESDLTPARKTAKLGSLAMRCRDVSVNDQGKLLIPKDLSEKAGIRGDSTIVLAGRQSYFEVWSSENFDKVLEIEQAQDDEDDLGVFD